MARTFEIQRTTIDGIPTFWADTPPGPFVALLSFRVGRADEPAAWGGVTHLVEHLALAPLGQQRYDHNGSVDALRTTFIAVGDPGDAVAFLGRVCASLADLPLDRILMERRILRREAEQAGPNIGGALRWYRFGLRGHGLLGQEDAGLGWLGPAPVGQWTAEHFTRQNAALVLSGPPPDDLRLPLPDGRRIDPVPLDPVQDVRFPAHLPWDGPGVTLSMVMPRLPESNMLLNIAQRRARQALRFERGLVYDVMPDYEPLDGTTAHAVLGADVPDAEIGTVARALVEVLDRLSSDGPTAEELDVEVEGFRRQFRDRDARIAFLDAMALDHLLGEREREPDEILANREAVDPQTARETLRRSLETALLLAAGNAIDEDRFHRYPAASSTWVEGREFKPAGFHLPGRGPRERMVLGRDGVSVRLESGDWLTVRFAECVLAEHYDGDIRILWGHDGHRVAIDASAWRDGRDLVAAVDAAVPPHVVACNEHGLGALADDPTEAAASVG